MPSQASKQYTLESIREDFANWITDDEKRRMEIAWAMSALNLDKLTQRQLLAVEYLLDRIQNVPEANNATS